MHPLLRLAPLLFVIPALGQKEQNTGLPEAPTANMIASVDGASGLRSPEGAQSSSSSGEAPPQSGQNKSNTTGGDVDSAGNPVPSTLKQPKRILGLMPNYRSVSGGAVAERPTARGNFHIATQQALDYSSFIFLGLTSLSAEGLNTHPSLGKGVPGLWGYTWRGFLDKTDNTYQSAFVLPTLLHEDGRYYAMGTGSKWKRLGYASSRVVVTRTYGGRETFNFAGIGGKVGAQAVSRSYYPGTASTFGVLATKFSYSVARDVGFTVFREFYPDIATHVLHRNP